MEKRILVLGPHVAFFRANFEDSTFHAVDSQIDTHILYEFKPSLVISYGYRHIVKKAILQELHGRIFNLHISLLPWNRGADPNLWSWLENSPRGVTIHHMESRLDEGPIAFQKEVDLDPADSLAETYMVLQREIRSLLVENWNQIVSGKAPTTPQSGVGTSHKIDDKKSHTAALTDGWNTRCVDVLEYGRKKGLWVEHH